jgi:hypothetical protein
MVFDRNPLRICRGCGCTDDRACPGGCSWVLLDFDYQPGHALTSLGKALAVLPAIRVVPLPSGICSRCAEDFEWDFTLMASAIDRSAVGLATQLGL